jgi:hypothetical protein
MRLSESQSRELLCKYGAYVTEACDKCGTGLGPFRWTIGGETGAWCSQKCRDGIERQVGMCQGCGVSLAGQAKRRPLLLGCLQDAPASCGPGE